MLIGRVHAVLVATNPLPLRHGTGRAVARRPRDRHLAELERRGALRTRRCRVRHVSLQQKSWQAGTYSRTGAEARAPEKPGFAGLRRVHEAPARHKPTG